jgi:N6-L-threonylcarbamoyladenine synthase
MNQEPLILAIESSCDDTSAAVLRGRTVLSNCVAGQAIHEKWGGVVPELASRAHQSHIIPVVHQALKEANCSLHQLDAIAVTQGPGLMGSLLVGFSLAKSMSLALQIPLIGVNHMEAHVMAHFIEGEKPIPDLPFLCLTVSGGHTQLVEVNERMELTVLGETIDDAAGEAFDKAAKIMGLPYPGGPHIDALAKQGNPTMFSFSAPQLNEYSFSFSGVKTSLLYFLQKQMELNPNFLLEHTADVCASYQRTIIQYLLKVTKRVVADKGYKQIGLAGGVSANSELRSSFLELANEMSCQAYIPPFAYCTDNAAMIGASAYYSFQSGVFLPENAVPLSRLHI